MTPAKQQATRRRRRVSKPYRYNDLWTITERRGDVVIYHQHETIEGARRLAGLRPREEER